MPRKPRVMPLRGERLKEMREKRGLSQTDLSERADVSKRQIGRYEHGKGDPTSDTLARIARALDVSGDYLIGLTDAPRSYVQSTDLTEDEAELIGLFRRGDIESVFRKFAQRLREHIKSQTIIPRLKPKKGK